MKENNIKEVAREQSRTYVSNALMRAIMLVEGAASQHEPGYHNFWLQVDAECLRIIAAHIRQDQTPEDFFA